MNKGAHRFETKIQVNTNKPMQNKNVVDIFDIIARRFRKKRLFSLSNKKRTFVRGVVVMMLAAIFLNGLNITIVPIPRDLVDALNGPKNANAHYQFTPTASNLVVGTEANVNGLLAASAEGVNTGSWKGTITDDNLHWMPSSTAGGLNAQLDIGGVTLNGANKFIVQTAVDADAAYNIKFQICDWVSSTSVDNAPDAQCTTGGWRSMNTQTAANADVNFATAATTNDVSLQWHLYDGYFTTGTTGGSAVSTPLANFVNSGTIKIRYFTATNGGAFAIDFLRVIAIVDPTYHPAGFVNSGSGVAAGTYVNANMFGNTASAALAAGDNVHLAVPGTAGSISDSYLIYKNIKTYSGMNTIYIRGEYGCSAATANVRYQFAIRNFTTNTWENMGQPTDCAASNTDIVAPFAKNNVTIADYISGSNEVWVRKYGTINSTTALRTDYQYITLGTTNSNTDACTVTYGAATGGRVYSDPAPNNTDNINAVATDASYMYLAGFATVNQDSEWRLEKRDLATGALVTAFDTDGIVQNDPGTGADQITAVAVDASYVYTAGYQNNGNDDWRIEKRDKTTGALVTAFDTDGFISANSTPSANQDRIYGLYVNGTHLFVVGEDGTTSTADRRWRVEKRDITTGALVGAFDTDGILNTTNASAGADVAYAITGDASYIYIVGVDVAAGTGQWRVEKRDITTGALVTAFDTDGFVQIDPNASALEEARAVSVNATHVYIGGYDRAAAANNDQWRVEKRDITTGALVGAFDTDGILNIAPSANQDRVMGLALDATDIYIVGEDRTESTTAARWRIEKRALSNGALTTAFDGDGIAFGQYNGHDRALAVSLQSSDLVVAGHGGGTSELWMTEVLSASTGVPDSGFNTPTCAATRDLNFTDSPNIFRVQSEDESTSSNDDFYPMDTELATDAVAEEAVALDMDFGVSVPSNAQVAGVYWNANYNGGSGLTMQTAMRDYSGMQQVTGGWTAMGAAASTSLVLTEPLVTGGFALTGPAGFMNNNPISYIDTVNGKMNMKIRTTTPAANNVNPVADIDFMMVSFSWIEDSNHPSVSYQFTPTGQTLVTGTSGARNSQVAAAATGSSIGSWKGTLADDNFHWTVTGTGAGFNAQLNTDGVQLNGANKMLIQTETDLDSAAAMKIQICDWVSSTSVDSAADAECTGGGWRSLNSQDAANADLNLTTVANGSSLQWHIHDGYWSTGTTGGTAVSTPLSNFISADANKRVKIRYYSTVASAVLDVDHLRIQPMIDSVYNASGFVQVAGGTVSGTYANTNVVGNTTTVQQTVVGSDNVKLNLAANAGAANDGYFIFKNIKTLAGMNTIAVRMEYICGSVTGTLTPKIRNFTSSTWENLASAGIACAASDATNGWAKNNVTLSDYINGSNEVWVGMTHNTANQSFAIDAAYIMIGSTNADTARCQITLGTGTATNCSDTRTLDMTGTTTNFSNPSEIDAANMGTGDANAYYAFDNEAVPDTNADHTTSSNISMPVTLPENTSVVGLHYSSRFTSGHANYTIQPGIKDYSGLNAALGGWVQVGVAAANTATYTDSMTALAINLYGYQTNPEDYVDTTNNLLNMRLRSTTNTALANAFTTLWDFAMLSVQWLEIPSAITISGTVYAANDSAVLTSYSSVMRMVVGTSTVYTTTASSGVFSFGSVETPSSGDIITVYLNSDGGSQGATVFKYGASCSGSPNCTGIRVVQNTLYLDSKNATSISNADLDGCDSDAGSCSGDSDIRFNVDAGALTVGYDNVKIPTGITFAPAGATTVGTLKIFGSFTPGPNTTTITNDWINDGTFTHGNGTVVISPSNNTPSQLNGANDSTFYNLTMTSGDRMILVKVGATVTVTNTLIVMGTPQQPVKLASALAAQTWNLTFTGSTATVDNATIADSACVSSNDIITGFNTYDLGNNGACWKFKPKGGGGGNSSDGSGAGGGAGGCVAPTATPTITDGKIVSVAIDTGGSCFAVPPSVVFVGDGGGAVATSTVVDGSVTAVTMVAQGSNYTTVQVRFTGGGGQSGGGSVDGGGAGGSGGQGGGGAGGGGGEASP